LEVGSAAIARHGRPEGSVVTSKDLMRRAQLVAETAAARKVDATRHKCFVSYHVNDVDEVTTFLDAFGSEFITRSVGVTDEDDFVDSTDTEYIKARIFEVYLTDSTVTIVLLGRCTWARKFVDWEISSSLRDDNVNKRSGLLAMPLPSMNNSSTLPTRIKDNWSEGDLASSYAVYASYPPTTNVLRDRIEEAFGARTAKADRVNNSRELRQNNAHCT
jgi:MTH538 TIR-like domain (DUF1863)